MWWLLFYFARNVNSSRVGNFYFARNVNSSKVGKTRCFHLGNPNLKIALIGVLVICDFGPSWIMGHRWVYKYLG